MKKIPSDLLNEAISKYSIDPPNETYDIAGVLTLFFKCIANLNEHEKEIQWNNIKGLCTPSQREFIIKLVHKLNT